MAGKVNTERTVDAHGTDRRNRTRKELELPVLTHPAPEDEELT